MIARVLIGQDKLIDEEIEKILSENEVSQNHPDVLLLPKDSKLGVEQTKQMIEFLSLKPYSAKSRVVILENAESLTVDAQNSLLKTLEELPDEALFILGANSDANFLPTVLSRCQVTILNSKEESLTNTSFTDDIEKLISVGIEERFEYVEKLKDKNEFLQALTNFFHSRLPDPKAAEFLKELLQAEEWSKSNVNLRGILEYLMLVLPTK